MFEKILRNLTEALNSSSQLLTCIDVIASLGFPWKHRRSKNSNTLIQRSRLFVSVHNAVSDVFHFWTHRPEKHRARAMIMRFPRYIFKSLIHAFAINRIIFVQMCIKWHIESMHIHNRKDDLSGVHAGTFKRLMIQTFELDIGGDLGILNNCIFTRSLISNKHIRDTIMWISLCERSDATANTSKPILRHSEMQVNF